MAILGGAKVSDKLSVIEALIDRVDALLVGGAMAFTLIAADGGEVAESLCERDRFEDVRRAKERARERGVLLEVPQDVVAAAEVSLQAERRTVPAAEIPRGLMGLDIGPQDGRGVRPHHRRREDDPVERPDGRVRARAVQRRDPGRGHGRRRMPTPSAWSAAATRCSRCARPSSPTPSTTCRPVGVHRSSSSRAAPCRASRSWRRVRDRSRQRPNGGRSSPRTGRCTRRTSRRSRPSRS